jgi:hypothetical protein
MPLESCQVTSIGELADSLRVQSWRIARLFELGIIPEPPRMSGRRAIPGSMVPTIVAGLRDRGWLPNAEEVAP